MIIIKKAFTLVELGVSLGVIGALSLVGAQESRFEVSQKKAQAMGNEIFQHNSAVSRYLAANSGDPSVIGISDTTSVIETGSDWLKGPECGGSAGISFLPCAHLPDNVTVQGHYSPETTISMTSEGALVARTVWVSGLGLGGEEDSVVMGTAALVASGNYVSQAEDGAAGYQAPTIYCPDMAVLGSTISTSCGTDRHVIVSSVNTNSTLEPWLRTDHGNTMQHVIEFSGSPSSQADINAVDNGTSGSGMRQIVNVARIYNRGSSGSDSLILGRQFGNGLMANGFVSAHGLLNNAVIVDGDEGVMGNFFVRLDALIEGNAQVEGDVFVGGEVRAQGHVIAEDSASDVMAGRDVLADRNVRSLQDVLSGRDIVSGRDISSGRNVSAVADVSSGRDVVAGRHVNASGNLYGVQFIDTTGGNTSDYGGGGWVANPSHDSRFNRMDFQGVVNFNSRLVANGRIELNETVSVGAGCSPNGSLARIANGQAVSCVSGRWKGPGGAGMVRAGRNSVTVSSDGSYSRVIVSAATKFSAQDGSHTRRANIQVLRNGSIIGTFQNSQRVQKGGSSGHYWGYEGGIAQQRMYSLTINSGDSIVARYVSGNRHVYTDLVVTLSN